MNKDSILKTITDFIIWLLFITTLLLTITLTIAGTYHLIAEPQWSSLMLFVAALITLGMHYGVRQMPVGGRPKSQRRQ